MMLNFFGACGGNQLRQRLSSDAGEGKINDIGVTEEIKKERFDRFQRIGPTELEENYTHSPYWLHHPLGSLEKKDVTQNRETSSNPEAKLRSRNLRAKNCLPVRNDSGGFHSFNHRIGEFGRPCLAAHIARKFIPITINLLQSVADLQGSIELADMAKHEKSAPNHSGGIGDIFACDIRRRAMNGLKYRTAIAEIRAWNKAEASHESGAQVGNDVAVKVFHHQHVVLIRIHDQLHAGVVYNVLAVGNLRIFLRYIARATEKKTIRQLHDIGFVDGVNLLALILASVFKSKAGDAIGSLLGDDLQTLHNARNNFVFKSGIKSLRILPDDDEINVRIASGDMRQIANGAEIRIKLEALAQFDINAGKAATDRRSYRTLQSNSRALDGLDQLARNVFVIFLVGVSAGFESFPFELQAGRF